MSNVSCVLSMPAVASAANILVSDHCVVSCWLGQAGIDSHRESELLQSSVAVSWWCFAGDVSLLSSYTSNQ